MLGENSKKKIKIQMNKKKTNEAQNSYMLETL
jgi:hypothetical protein